MSGSSISAILRAVITFPLIRIPLLGGLLFLAMGISNGFMASNRDSTVTALALVAMMVTLALAVYWVFVRYAENRPVRELSPAGMGGEFSFGLLLGLGLYSGCILVLYLLGHYRIEGLNSWMAMLAFVPLVISSSFFEELIHRGVVFRVTEEYLGSWIALIASSALFGARHLGNPDATLVGALFVAFEAGLLLGAAYMLTRRLWLPIGLHLSWNFAQAALFSGTVSGVGMPPGLLKSAIVGPELMTGGRFGVEASIIAFLACSAAAVILLAMAVRRGGVVRPFWRRGS